MSFAGSGFARFMASPAGRLVRIVAGIALIAWGLPRRAAAAGIVGIALGIVMVLAGALNYCAISALLGGPLRGSDIPEKKPGT
jgi:DUF2892 family protein